MGACPCLPMLAQEIACLVVLPQSQVVDCRWSLSIVVEPLEQTCPNRHRDEIIRRKEKMSGPMFEYSRIHTKN